jgi:hypothetical protein
MSNRTEKQVSKMAAMRVSHLAQIEALCGEPPANPNDRVHKFFEAGGLTRREFRQALLLGEYWRAPRFEYSAAFRCWQNSHFKPTGLFADLPDCKRCPVNEGLLPVPSYHWKPTRKELERFSKIQIAHRFPSAL